MTVVINGALIYEQRDLLLSKLAAPTEVLRLRGSEPEDERVRTLAAADVLISMTNRGLPPSPHLRLLQVPGAGVDQVDLALVPPQATVCNAYGHDVAGGEYIVLAMLAWCHRFVEMHESFKEGTWRMNGRFGAPPHEELFGKTVGIVGQGPIGLAAARLAKAFGTTVIALNRTVREKPAFVDELYPLSELRAQLPRFDFLALCVASTPETIGMLDAAALQAMKRSAVLINIARASLVDERALYDALRDRTIAGAVLDAWYRYPSPDNERTPPSEFPFRELPNVLITPHAAAWTTGMIERRWTEIAHNINALARGELQAMQNVVRPAAEAAPRA